MRRKYVASSYYIQRTWWRHLPHRFAVYGLIDPRTGEIRYIGQSFDPHGRWVHTCRLQRGDKQPELAEWISNLRDVGSKPFPTLLGGFETRDEAVRYEARMIEALADTCNLVNTHTRFPSLKSQAAA